MKIRNYKLVWSVNLNRMVRNLLLRELCTHSHCNSLLSRNACAGANASSQLNKKHWIANQGTNAFIIVHVAVCITEVVTHQPHVTNKSAGG